MNTHEQELHLILEILKDSIADLDHYSVHNDDVFNDEIAELFEIVRKIKEKQEDDEYYQDSLKRELRHLEPFVGGKYDIFNLMKGGETK